MNLPSLELGKYFVLRAEQATGIIVNNDDSRYSDYSTPSDYYMIFNSLEEARSYAQKNKQLNLPFETIIMDNNGNYLECIR